MVPYSKCSNYASDTCPCVLAENGHCIVCPMCAGEDFCSCSDAVSFCILQELKNNGGHAKEPHEVLSCTVTSVKKYGENLSLIHLRVPGSDPWMFKRLGCYVFVRVKDNPFFDVPISVLYDDTDKETISLLIQARGIKTDSFRSVKKGDTVYLRGPYFNGIQGTKAVSGLHDGRALVLCRGLGLLPSIQVIEALRVRRNRLTVYLDEGQFDRHLLDLFMDLFEIPAADIAICDEQGNLSESYRGIMADAVRSGTDLIHLGMSDYLIRKSLQIMKDQERNAAVSWINNSHMCCGEGICGACAFDIGPGRTIHLCKEQLSLDEYKTVLGDML